MEYAEELRSIPLNALYIGLAITSITDIYKHSLISEEISRRSAIVRSFAGVSRDTKVSPSSEGSSLRDSG